MKIFAVSRMVWPAVIASFIASAQLATNITVTNLQGKVYSNITLDHTNALGLIWRAQDGSMGQIRFTDLSVETWNQLNLPDGLKRSIVAFVSKQIAEEAAAKAAQEEADRQARAAKAEADRQARADQEAKDKLQAEILAEVRSTTNSEEQQINSLKAKPALMSSEEKTARDNILKALLDVSSATSVGVTRNDYSSLLAKAVSSLTFEKTQLKTERHVKYLFCAEKAIGYYTKANDEWSDYFKYDWMREREETMMSQFDFMDLARNGLKIDISTFRNTENSKTTFYVPFQKCLRLYWEAADIYVEKMKNDAQM